VEDPASFTPFFWDPEDLRLTILLFEPAWSSFISTTSKWYCETRSQDEIANANETEDTDMPVDSGDEIPGFWIGLPHFVHPYYYNISLLTHPIISYVLLYHYRSLMPIMLILVDSY
jgi:hypothetical protein